KQVERKVLSFQRHYSIPPRCQGPIYYFLVFAFFSSVRAEGARVYFEFHALFYVYLFFYCFRLSHGAKRPEGSKKAPAWQALCDGFVENAGVCIIFVKMNFEKFPVRPGGGRAFHSRLPVRVMTDARTASGAVSQRRMRGPSPTVLAPAATAAAASSGAKPPSAPVTRAIRSGRSAGAGTP